MKVGLFDKMADLKKRVLWLINHTTLRKFEIPLLINLGYEVYVPKIFPYDEGNMSASTDYSYDSTLSISNVEVDLLNKVNFYEYIPSDAVEIINKHFQLCVFSFFPQQMREIIRKFLGVMIFRPFGLDNSSNYTSLLMSIFGFSFFEELNKIKDRFFFGQAYENLSEIEAEIFKHVAITLPIGLESTEISNLWLGDKERILFVCPRIGTSSYYKKIYEEFRAAFKEFDYIIGGAQPIKTSDSKVAGFLSKEEYEDMYYNSRVMFYHSREKRHVHYHPFEAIKCGLPLIFMAGGMLDSLGGINLPGRCENISQAKKKIKRIMHGDKNFISKIKNTQVILLNKLSYAYCKPIWEENFKLVEKRIEGIAKLKKTKKIGIILGEGYTGGVLDFTVRLIKALKNGIEENNADVEMVFGYVNKPIYKEKNYFEKIEELNINIRSFEWKMLTNDQVKEIIKLKYGKDFDTVSIREPIYYTLDDGIGKFNDCDYLIFSVDRVPGPIFVSQPYIVCVHDYIQRYLPEMFGGHYEKSLIDFVRFAEIALVNTKPAHDDLVQYAGVPKHKIRIIPPLFEEINYIEDNRNRDLNKQIGNYFLWSTNVSKHKNHKIVLEGLSDYYLNGGKLNCIVTGVYTDKFNLKNEYHDGGYIQEIRDILNGDEYLKNRIEFMGNLSKNRYYKLLKNAKFLLHGGLIDNGNGSIVDAALLGVPSISSLYHAMEYHEKRMKLNIRFFDPYKPKDLSKVLFKTENDYDEFKKSMPEYEDIVKFTIKYTYREVYKQINEIVQF